LTGGLSFDISNVQFGISNERVMNTDDERERGARLLRAMQSRTQAWLADAIGVAVSSVNGYLKGKVPMADVALRMCDVLAIDIRWYLTGEARKEETGEKVMQVPFLDDPSRALTFPSGLLGSFGVPPDSLCCLEMQGTLMAPAIPRGAEILATRSFDDIVDGRLYIIDTGRGHMLRRARVRADRRIEAVCDNVAAQQEMPDFVDYAQVVALALWSGCAL
jgi:DNA-binding XRE family transcriptional regulator